MMKRFAANQVKKSPPKNIKKHIEKEHEQNKQVKHIDIKRRPD